MERLKRKDGNEYKECLTKLFDVFIRYRTPEEIESLRRDMGDGSGPKEREKQQECLICEDFDTCYKLSQAKTIGRFLAKRS